MLDKLRAGALALIATTPECTLSTSGPAGIQASMVACLVYDNCIYVLVPSTTDQLFNLEHETDTVMTTSCWQLRGTALILGLQEGLHGTAPTAIRARADAAGLRVIEVFPLRMQIPTAGPQRHPITIDFDLPCGIKKPLSLQNRERGWGEGLLGEHWGVA